MTKSRELHDIITRALEFNVFDHGDATAIITTAFEVVVDILLKHPRFAGVPRFEIELLLRDTQLKTESALAKYSLPNPELDAAAIVDALLDAPEFPRHRELLPDSSGK
jgi:hypothetical protein